MRIIDSPRWRFGLPLVGPVAEPEATTFSSYHVVFFIFLTRLGFIFIFALTVPTSWFLTC